MLKESRKSTFSENVEDILALFHLGLQRYVYRKYPLPMNWTDEERERGLALLYRKQTGKRLDWNHLELFTEKLQWYKLYYSHPDLSRIVDKVGFKPYIEEKLGPGYTIPMYGAWKTVEDIAWDSLPRTFVLKSNCQSEGRCIRFIRNKDEEDFEKLKAELREWLIPRNTLLDSFCRAYYGVTPMILAEEYQENIANELYDYKIFCFGGVPECIYVAAEHFTGPNYLGGYPISFYDFDWNLLDIHYGDHCVKELPRPRHLEEMVELAKRLSKEFPFVRVDFFDTEERLFLAELTFYPGGGYTSYPERIDRAWGEKLVLPPKSPLGRVFQG